MAGSSVRTSRSTTAAVLAAGSVVVWRHNHNSTCSTHVTKRPTTTMTETFAALKAQCLCRGTCCQVQVLQP